MNDVTKWVNYLNRLLDQGKGYTREFAAVQEMFTKALSAASAALQEVHAKAKIVQAAPKPPEKKIRLRPDNDTPAEWQKYLDDLAIAGEEDSPEYLMGKYRLEKASRPHRPALLGEPLPRLGWTTPISFNGRLAHLSGRTGGDFTHALNSAGGYGDTESLRHCRRCKIRFVRDATDPERCANCFAPKQRSHRVVADELDAKLYPGLTVFS